MDQLQKVLDYWFGSSEDDVQVSAEKGALWFGKSTETDREIEQQFGTLVREASDGHWNERVESSQDRLAVILLLDQFTRNIYRGKPECFASDSLALQLALDGLSNGDDQQLRPVERVFLFLPLEHSEELAMQNRSVELFAQLLETVPEEWRNIFAGYHDYAVRHREIIERYGRFPHRNEIMSRTSTPEEIEFLQQPGSSF